MALQPLTPRITLTERQSTLCEIVCGPTDDGAPWGDCEHPTTTARVVSYDLPAHPAHDDAPRWHVTV